MVQSLLRGRFLRSGRLVQDKKSSSLAANELGLLRQRHTVAGLRYRRFHAIFRTSSFILFLSVFLCIVHLNNAASYLGTFTFSTTRTTYQTLILLCGVGYIKSNSSIVSIFYNNAFITHHT